jgi:predicted RNA-binding Zn ribbon-like protein
VKASRATRDDLRSAIELREALRSLLLGNNGFPIGPDTVATVNTMLSRARLLPRLTAAGRVVLEPEATGVAGALGRIVGVVVAAMLDGSWTRLKACRQCSWSYFDYSRNRSARWCSMSICGNRLKTRAYRRRRSQP